MGDSNPSLYSGEENWSRYMSSKCRRWTGFWSVFNSDTLQSEACLKVIKRCHIGDDDVTLEHVVEEDLSQSAALNEDDKSKSELFMTKEDAMQLKRNFGFSYLATLSMLFNRPHEKNPSLEFFKVLQNFF